MPDAGNAPLLEQFLEEIVTVVLVPTTPCTLPDALYGQELDATALPAIATGGELRHLDLFGVPHDIQLPRKGRPPVNPVVDVQPPGSPRQRLVLAIDEHDRVIWTKFHGNPEKKRKRFEGFNLPVVSPSS
jgi:hypothetical protein